MFKNIFSFDGRIRRTEFCISYLIYWISYLIVRYLSEGMGGEKAILLLVIPLLWFLWAQGAKRCHDLDHSGWWQIIPFYVFWMMFQDGNPNENWYGTNPKTPEEFDAHDYQSPVITDSSFRQPSPPEEKPAE